MATFLDESKGIIDPHDVSVRPLGMQWGLIWGLIGVALSLIFTLTGTVDPSKTQFFSIANLLTWTVSGVIVYMALVAHRDNELGGYITLGRCVSFVVFMSLIAGIITAIYIFVYFGYINPDFMDKVMEAQMEKAEEKGQDPEKVRQAMEMTKAFTKPGSMALITLLSSVISGVLWGLVVGFFVKKETSRPF